MNTPQKTDDSTLAQRLQPRDYGQLVDQADMLIQSRLCPDHFEDASDIVLVAQQGAELGVNVMTALQNSHVIHGNVGWDADFLKALCLKSGECEAWQYREKSSNRCAVSVKRRGHEPEKFSWTKKKAKHAGLWKSSPSWKSQPDVMLRHRVDAEAARAIFPDVVSGIHTPDELRDPVRAETGEVEVSDATPTQKDRSADVDTINAELMDGADDKDTNDDPDEPETSIETVDDAQDYLAETIEGLGVDQVQGFMDFLAYHHTGDYTFNGLRDEDKISLARDLEGKTPSRSIPPRVIGGVDQFLRDHDIGECDVSHSLKNARAEVSKNHDLLTKS